MKNKITAGSIVLLATVFYSWSCFSQNKIGSSQYIHALKKVTDVMVNDATSPVAASRYYAYTCLASYEMVSAFDTITYRSFAGLLNGYHRPFLSIPQNKTADRDFAVILTILKSGEKLLPSGYLLRPIIDSAILHATIRKEVLATTIQLADELVHNMIKYSREDGFPKLNNYMRYTPRQGDAYWQPTPPTFMAGIEPHWNMLRPFTLDSAQQCKPLPPTPYSTDTQSPFYKQLKEVYDCVNRKDPKEMAIASFWDCNPFAVQQIGHVEYGLKKISPGGHWIGITGIACQKKKMPLALTARTHTLVAIALADAFIACWDEKYRSNRVRPETAIKKLIDNHWTPLLQTPPFPEYVSGHSVVSTTAAALLTKIFGPRFSFIDDVEVEYGLPQRKFRSFNTAAAEAALSRLYGGIHYRDAIERGAWQGQKTSGLLFQKLQVFFTHNTRW